VRCEPLQPSRTIRNEPNHIVPIRSDECRPGTSQCRINTRFNTIPHGFESHSRHHRFARQAAEIRRSIAANSGAHPLQISTIRERNYCAAVALGGKCSSR
jgi:hypothetical protein